MKKYFLTKFLTCLYLALTILQLHSTVLPEDIIIYPQNKGISAKQMILNEIRSAQSSIQMSVYHIKEADIVQALCERSANGVVVDLIHEEQPYQHEFNKNTKPKYLCLNLI